MLENSDKATSKYIFCNKNETNHVLHAEHFRDYPTGQGVFILEYLTWAESNNIKAQE